MITINLLPKERRKVATNLLFNLGVVIVTLALVGASIVGAIGIQVAAAGMSAKLRNVEQQLDDHAEVLELVAQLEEYKGILDQKKEVIDTLVKGRIEWGRKLWEMAQMVPERVWLERLQLETIITKEKVKQPEGQESSRSRSRTPQFREVRTDFLHVYAVTHDLEKKSSIIGDFINRIRSNESFFSDFDTVDFQEGEEQPWVTRDKESPPVWRFRLTLQLKSRARGGSSGGASEGETT